MVSDFNNNSNDNSYYYYHHKNFKKQRFLVSNLTDKTRDYREFYGARIKLTALCKALNRN